jgi:hypothetical protein
MKKENPATVGAKAEPRFSAGPRLTGRLFSFWTIAADVMAETVKV